MYKITANDWDGMKCNTLHNSIRRTNANNGKMKEIAKKYALKERNNPSPLEKKMQEFLDCHNIKYKFQKPCYIYKNKVIVQFFILDFYIPTINIVIETDGKFHDNQKEYDNYRTESIKKIYPGIRIIRWRSDDFHSVTKMKKLLEILKEKKVEINVQSIK